MFKRVRVANVLTFLSPSERNRSTTLGECVDTTNRMLLQSEFKITSAADIERVIGATQNVDPRHPLIILIGSPVAKMLNRSCGQLVRSRTQRSNLALRRAQGACGLPFDRLGVHSGSRVGLLRQVVGQVDRRLDGLGRAEPMLRDQTRKIAGVDATR